MKLLFILIQLFGGPIAAADCAKVLRDLNAPIRGGSEKLLLPRGSLFPIKAKSPSRTKYSLLAFGKEVVVTADAIEVTSTCGRQRSNWSFGADVGWLSGYGADDFQGLVTAVPNPSNVGGLQDPIVTGVSGGEGFVVRAVVERSWKDFWRLQGDFGYRRQEFSYQARNNPSLFAVDLASLPAYSKSFTSERLQAGLGFGALHRFGPWALGYSLNADLLYNLSQQQKIQVLVSSGSFFKNTPATVTAGPPDIDYELSLRLEARLYQAMLFGSINPQGALIFGAGFLW